MKFDKQEILEKIQLFYENYEKENSSEKLYLYKQSTFLLFFVIMTLKKVYKFKAMHRWLENNSKEALEIGFTTSIPVRTTISRRYKSLENHLLKLIEFISLSVNYIDKQFETKHQFVDKSLYKAEGNLWHSKDQKNGTVPKGLRNIDKEATWSKSAYHGWVFGYGLTVFCNKYSFPIFAEVETASYSESKIIDRNEAKIFDSNINSLTGDDGYTNLLRIKNFWKKGIALFTSALKVKPTNDFKTAYKELIKTKEVKKHFIERKTSVEPFFDLSKKIIGQKGKLSLKGLKNVKTCLLLSVLIIQVAMIFNYFSEYPFREISNIVSIFT